MSKKRARAKRGRYDQNLGKPGVVYILENDAFPHLLKIGQSTRSAFDRVRELNTNCGTENPGRFSIIHERHTVDCGRAEKDAHAALLTYKFRKEYFEVDAYTAKAAVDAACARYDEQDLDTRERRAKEKDAVERNRINKTERLQAVLQAQRERAQREAADASRLAEAHLWIEKERRRLAEFSNANAFRCAGCSIVLRPVGDVSAQVVCPACGSINEYVGSEARK